MKKIIYISGISCANLMMLGCMFKIMHWPGASVLLVLAIFLFCFLFLPFALINSFQGQEQSKHKWLYIVTFIVFSIAMMGVLFKIMHWPGAGMFLLIGIPLPFILFLPVYLYHTRNERKGASLNFLGIMFGLIFLAVFGALLALNVSKSVLDKIALSVSYNDKSADFNTAAVKKGSSDPVKKQADELSDYINFLKCELLTRAENEVCDNNKLKAGYDPLQIVNKDYEIAPNFLYGGNNNKIAVLKMKINNFRETLLSSGKTDQDLKELCSSLFDVSNNSEDLSWEQRQFKSSQLIIVLDVLTQIQSNVRLAEAEFLECKAS